MADYGVLFQLMLAALTFVIIGMFFIVYLMIIGEREKKKLRAMVSSVAAKREAEHQCPHFFGYLSRYPINQPIPEECFGCVRAIECMNITNVVEQTTEEAELPLEQQQ